MSQRFSKSALRNAVSKMSNPSAPQQGGAGASSRQERRAFYQSLSTLSSRYGYHNSNLTAAEAQVFSQNGEDGVIAEVLDRIGVKERFFVEFGIGKGRVGNCILLADVLSWSGLFLECDPGSFTSLSSKYRHNPRVSTLKTLVTPENVDELFTQAGCPRDVDVVSIDVDGQDYWIWEALRCVRPRIVVIEYNSGLPADEELVEPKGRAGGWDNTDYFGASIAALVRLGQSKGYTLAHQEMAGVNAFFVRDDLLDKFGEITTIARTPNYWLRGGAHPVDPYERPYTRLTTPTVEAGGGSNAEDS